MIHGKLVRRPFDPTPFGNLLDRVLAPDAFNGQTWPLSGDSGFVPAVDVYEADHGFVFVADLPGLKREDVELTIEDNVLTLSGTRTFGEDVQEDAYRRLERSYGRFSRHFTLPNNIDAAKVDATFKDGVLEIRVPKSEAARSRKVEIQ